MSNPEAPSKMFINGEFVDSLSGETMDVISPANGKCIATVPRGTAADVERAIGFAESAWREYRKTTPGERQRLLLKLADIIEQNAEEFSRIESMNVGKPISEAHIEPPMMVDNLRFFAGAARMLEGRATAEYVRGYSSTIRREPLGIVAGICPWNYPLFVTMWKFAPALAAGNVSIIKPAEQTPLSVLRFLELAQGVLPRGVLQVVTGDGVPTGDALVRHPKIRLVSLTGDTTTGKIVAANAAQSMKRVHLELGGQGPMVVLEDADPATVAAKIAVGGYFNAGQDCTKASRLLVHSDIYDAVVAASIEAIKAIRVGDPADPNTVMGPVISAEQKARVLGFVERAVSGGARVLAGGRGIDGPGFFIQPTLLAGFKQSDEIIQNEVFGPVVTVQRFSSDEEAIAMANGVRYGLAASVHTQDLNRATKISSQLDFGTVWINEHLLPLTPEMPHGGFKESGYGKDMSMYSLEEYTQVKHVCTNLN